MSDDKLAKNLLATLKYLKDIRSRYEQTWQDVADHVVPIREDIKVEKKEGQRLGTKIYDGTPLNALQLFADGLHGYLISPATLWFRLTLDIPLALPRGAVSTGPTRPYISDYSTLEEIPEVRAWLQETGIAMYRAYQRSNFYSAMSPYFEDGGSIGTATIYSEENISSGRIVFTTLHPGQVYVAENQYGEVDTVFRTDKIEAKKLAERFGREKLSDDIKQALQNEPYKKFPFLHAMYPRTKRNPDKEDGSNKPIASVWVDIQEQQVVRQSGYNQNPCNVWRYRKSSHETYGRSPAMYALADILTLNKIGKTLLGAGEISARPAWNVPAEMEGKVRIRPHGMNYYGDDHNRIIRPVQSNINYPISKDREDRRVAIIEKHFHVDFFLMLARAPRQMTATEIVERQGEKAALLGTAIGRLNRECLDPGMDRVFQIEHSAGRLPEIPAILADFGGVDIGVDYLGPLAQAQKRLFRTRGITHGLTALQPLAEIFPQVLDIVDPDEAAREVLDAYGFPQKATKTKEEVEALRKERAALEQQQAEQAQLAQGSEALQGAGATGEDQIDPAQLMESLQGAMAGTA